MSGSDDNDSCISNVPRPVVDAFLRIYAAFVFRRKLCGQNDGAQEFTFAAMQGIRDRLLDHHWVLSSHDQAIHNISSIVQHPSEALPHARIVAATPPGTSIDFLSPDITVARTPLEFVLFLRGLTLDSLGNDAECVVAVNSLLAEIRCSSSSTFLSQQPKALLPSLLSRKFGLTAALKSACPWKAGKQLRHVRLPLYFSLLLIALLSVSVLGNTFIAAPSYIVTPPAAPRVTLRIVTIDEDTSKPSHPPTPPPSPHFPSPVDRHAESTVKTDVGHPPPHHLLHNQSCGEMFTNTHSGFAREAPIDSIVSVTFDAPEGSDALSDVVAAMTADMGSESSDYFTFLSKRAAELRTVSTAGALENFAMDVVYTYLNPLAASHHNAQQTICRGERECADKRFRDWNELQHSMRGLYYRAMCTRDGKHCGEAGSAADGALVRHIHIVVADRDQIPEWLNATHPLVSVVTHGELFAGDGNGMPALPTLNSHAIESALHRIPGLSRYFVYFNNDMFFGRRLSFFDYFRPLSPWRQAQREAILPAALTPNVTSSRRTIMFEPIFYFENIEDPNEFQFVRKSFFTQVEANSSCVERPIRFARTFEYFYRVGTRVDTLRHLSNFNKKLIVDRIVGGWPSHSFAHYPRLMDLAILTEMQEVDFADVSRATRQQRLRTTESLWTTYVYQYYAMGHRRAVDAMLLLRLGATSSDMSATITMDLSSIQTPSDLALFADTTNNFDSQYCSPRFTAANVPSIATSKFPPEYSKKSLSSALSRNGGDSPLLHEKLFGRVVSLWEKKEAVYFFGILELVSHVIMFTSELQAQPKLFITLNDDILIHGSLVRDYLRNLMLLLGGGDDLRAAWEMR